MNQLIIIAQNIKVLWNRDNEPNHHNNKIQYEKAKNDISAIIRSIIIKSGHNQRVGGWFIKFVKENKD